MVIHANGLTIQYCTSTFLFALSLSLPPFHSFSSQRTLPPALPGHDFYKLTTQKAHYPCQVTTPPNGPRAVTFRPGQGDAFGGTKGSRPVGRPVVQ
ncbi:uncharacterized protein F5Z01DRAFT_669203 [Emericellopsis atlantica]|uniref:Uncharacterized protein n=1 Tax=Emericellopsis atlantica TaxID=2614577 RepID=A0A9P8CJX3_9HYPO|nr:uncharacterized protein F5Z01DRAFT_669203 [Emericellopsis atlantica]KAG9249447.1 hypothetical protein F5Z01DRAFT_669203 [Emericellopsis atlantica]